MKRLFFGNTTRIGKFLWTPANVSTVFWLDATQSSTITISTGVSQWADKKGGGINAIQSNSSAQPSYSSTLFPGNFPGVLFDGVDDYLAISTTAMRNLTHGVYWVCARRGPGTGDAYRPDIGIQGSGDRGALHYIKNSNNLGASYPYYNDTGFYDLTSGTAYVTNVAQIMAFQGNVTGWGVWRNGTIEGTTSSFNAPGVNNTGYTLSRQLAPNRISNLVFGEVIMIQITDTTIRQKVEGYLAWKWGLVASLPVTHPYKNAPPYL